MRSATVTPFPRLKAANLQSLIPVRPNVFPSVSLCADWPKSNPPVGGRGQTLHPHRHTPRHRGAYGGRDNYLVGATTCLLNPFSKEFQCLLCRRPAFPKSRHWLQTDQ